MKKLTALILTLCITLPCFGNCIVLADEAAVSTTEYTFDNPDTSGWFSWSMPDEKLAKGTAIDMSHLLDAPAGKYGFVSTEGDNLVFEDGTKARFWGTNVTSPIFTDYETLDYLADRIARVGYNIVRFHALDAHYTTNNIFGVNNGRKTTNQLDPDQLDKMFYFMAKLKEKGIYYYVDLVDYRSVLSQDEMYTKAGVTYISHAEDFDDDFLEVQKEHARLLFTTVNPYTGLALKDDPAMALIQLHNEKSLAGLIAGEYSGEDIYKNEYFANVLTTKFNIWLKNKYNSTTELASAWAPTSTETASGLTALADSESLENGTIIFNYKYATDTTVTAARKSDTDLFIYDTLGNTYSQLVDYIKNTLGVKCPISGASMANSAENYAALAANDEFTDFIDDHSYNSHPTNYFNNGSVFQGFQSSLADSVKLFTRGLVGFRTQKPFIVGEYNQCIPNPWGAETEVIMATMASIRNWYPFNYSMGGGEGAITDRLNDAFHSYESRVRTAMQPSSALMYLRGDIKEEETELNIPVTREMLKHNSYGGSDYGATNGYFPDYAQVKFQIFDDIDEYNAFDQTKYFATRAALNAERNNYGSGEMTNPNFTDQLYWSYKKVLMKLTTDYTNVFSGNYSGQSYESANAIMESSNTLGTMTLVSLTDDTLADTEHMLLTAAARERNTGMVFDGAKMTNKGTAPILIEPVNADVTIKTTAPIAVYALDASGQRKAGVPVIKTDAGYKFSPSGEFETMYYEIIKLDTAAVFTDADNQNEAVTVYGRINSDTLSDKNVSIEICKDSSSDFLISATAAVDDNGYFNTDISLDELASGEYKAILTVDGKTVSSDAFTYTEKVIYSPDTTQMQDNELTYFNEAAGCRIIDDTGAVGGDVEKVNVPFKAINAITYGNAADPADETKTVYKISYANTAYPIEFKTNAYNVTSISKSFAYLRFDIYKPTGITDDLVLSIRDGVSGKQINLDISDFISDDGWQTVKVPFSAFPSSAEFDWDTEYYYIGIGFAKPQTAEIYIRDMYIDGGMYEFAKYDYEDSQNEVINIIEGGKLQDDFGAAIYNNGTGEPVYTKDISVNGENSIKIDFATADGSIQFGGDTGLFAAISNPADYILAMRVKFSNASPNSIAFVKSTSLGGASTQVGCINSYFMPTTGWQNVEIPLSAFTSESLASAAAVGFGVDSTQGSNLPSMYINDLKLVPNTATRINYHPRERTMSDVSVIYRTQISDRAYSLFEGGSGSGITTSQKGFYGPRAMLVSGGKYSGIQFDVSDLGITEQNCGDLYLKFDVCSNNSLSNTSVAVGRAMSSDLDRREKAVIAINPISGTWQTLIVPLSSITSLSGLSWSDTDTMFIYLNSGEMYRKFSLENISIGEYVNGKFEIIGADFVIQEKQ